MSDDYCCGSSYYCLNQCCDCCKKCRRYTDNEIDEDYFEPDGGLSNESLEAD